MIYPSGPATAKVFIVGEFPGEGDLLKSRPFSSASGYELKKILSEANLFFESCYVTYVYPDRCTSGIDSLIAKNKTSVRPHHVLYQQKYITPELLEYIERLKQELLLVKPNVVVAMGNLALFALTGQWGVNSWRSSVMESTLIPGLKVIPTISPNILYAQWKWRPLIVHDFKRVRREMQSPDIIRPEYNFLLRPDYATAHSVLTQLAMQAKAAAATEPFRLACDIETRAGHIACIGFAWSSLDAICIPLMCLERPEGYWTLEEEANLVYLIQIIFQYAVLIGQNFNYDAQYIYRHWHFIARHPVRDTMLKQHSCFSNMDKNLAFLSSMYCDDHLYWKDDRTLWQQGEDGEGENSYWQYNCTDAVRTYAIDTVLDSVVSGLKLQAVSDFQQTLALPVLNTMNKGIRVDNTARAAFALELMESVASREAYLLEVLGREVNIKSPKQMQELFYDEFAQPVLLGKKTQSPTTDDEALRRISTREPILKPITNCISELRSLGVFHSTFVSAPLDTDGRIRTSFNIAGTDTYRFASSKNAFGSGLNVQNIPSGGDTGSDGLSLPNVRKLFLPDPGHTFFDIDLDSADLRIVAYESDCKWLKAQLNAGRKPYVEVAKEYYRDPTITKHHKSYPVFKALCHGTHYLGTPSGLAPRIGLLVHEVERIQKWYYDLCPEIKVWQEEIKKQVSGRRYITNILGYRFHFFDKIEGTIFNQAVAWIPQSTVACIINRGYVNIHNNLPEAQVLLQVHDSLAGQYPSHLGWVKDRIIEESRITLPYAEPLVIPVGIKTSTKSWGDCI
jgi:uracil-DNA glycosylase family 4